MMSSFNKIVFVNILTVLFSCISMQAARLRNFGDSDKNLLHEWDRRVLQIETQLNRNHVEHCEKCFNKWHCKATTLREELMKNEVFYFLSVAKNVRRSYRKILERINQSSEWEFSNYDWESDE